MKNNVVLRVCNLKKTYHGVNALDKVNITLEQGKIYGLIGQNGAGKSTLMRLIAGISFPSDGEINLFGHTGEKELQVERKRMGCMIEGPSLIPNLTAKDNLRFHRIMKGIPNKEIENELLTRVNLEGTAKKKAKDFSLGMKQRLGIAIAMIGNPEFLILDEPINGLDPIGVVEVRNLLKSLCEELQMTILISSHNLPELYQTATDYIVIHQGKIKKTMTLGELDESCQHHILIKSDDPEKLTGVLETKLKTRNYKVMPDRTIRLYDYLDEKEKVSRVLFENEILVTNLSNEGDTLEDYFISIVGGEKNA